MNEYIFDEIQIGHTESFQVGITQDMEDEFRRRTGDINPLHQSDEFARKAGEGRFRGHIVFGMLTASFYSTLAGVYLPGKYSLIHSLETKFLKPVYAGDRLTVTGQVTARQEDLKLIIVKAVITNQEGRKVSTANIKILMMEQED